MKYIFWLFIVASAPLFSANSASIVPGSLVQGDVKETMFNNSYAQEINALNDWCLDTGGWGGNIAAISFTNCNFNGSSWGGTPNTMVAFGNGGSVTLELDNSIQGVDGQKELGIFTAQMLNAASGSWINGHMEASVLLSADGSSWVTLDGTPVAQNYTGSSEPLNVPTMGYDFGTLSTAWSYGSPGTTQNNLDALAIADYTTPMINDDLFNGNGTNADRMAMQDDHSTENYDLIFGASGGGNWFDVSNCGLSRVGYIQLNAVNCSPAMGVRLDAVYTIDAAVASYCGDSSHPMPTGDLNQDCRVNFQDYAIFAGYWLTVISDPGNPARIADLYADNLVDIEDLRLMAENWLVCTFECE